MSLRWIFAILCGTALGGCRESAPTSAAPGRTPPPIVSAAPGNVAPGAMFAIAPRYPQPGDTVTLDGSYSHDPDGQVIRYRWDFGNGVTQATGAQAKTVFRTAGTYTVSLTTVDDGGDSSTTSVALPVGTGGTPPTAVGAAQSTLTLSSASVAAGTGVTATVTARTSGGATLSGVPVAVSALGRNVTVTPATGTTNGSGVSTAVLATTIAQNVTVRAVADYTALTATPALAVLQSTISASRSSIRLTQSTLTALTDSAIVEVTARDTAGNIASNVLVTLSSSVTGLSLPASGFTDANGRWTGVVRITALCGAATLSATVGGIAITPTATITSNAAAIYGVCGSALWLDGADSTTMTTALITFVTRLSQWRDKSGNARHAMNATTAEQPAVIANGLHSLRVVRFTTASLLRSQNVLQGISDAADVIVVASATAAQSGSTYLFLADSQLTHHSGERFSAHLPWTDGLAYWDLGTCCDPPGRMSATAGAAGAALPAAVWGFGSAPGSIAERYIRRNGTALNVGAGTDALAFADKALRIGTNWGGDIAEFIVFPRTLTTTERTAIEHGLMAKWSLGTFALTAGNSQSAAAGTSPSTAPQVRVTDAAGNGIPNASVTFTVTSGGGRVNGATSHTVTTNTSGYATTATWVLNAGANQLTASYGSQSVVFTGTGTLPSGVQLRLDFGDASSMFTSDACTGAVTNLSMVHCVLDRSGNSNNAIQTVTGSGPTFVTSGLNGRSSLTFDVANDQYLRITTAAIRNLRIASRTLVVAVRPTSTFAEGNNNAGGIFLWDGFNTGMLSRGYPTPFLFQQDDWQLSTGGNGSFTALGITANTTIVGTGTLTVTPTTFQSRLFRNSAADSTTGGLINGTMANATDAKIGISGPGTGGFNWRFGGSMGEILLFDRVLTAAERIQVERYLGWKWGVTIP